jgi:hypothetical protein
MAPWCGPEFGARHDPGEKRVRIAGRAPDPGSALIRLVYASYAGCRVLSAQHCPDLQAEQALKSGRVRGTGSSTHHEPADSDTDRRLLAVGRDPIAFPDPHKRLGRGPLDKDQGEVDLGRAECRSVAPGVIGRCLDAHAPEPGRLDP